MLRTLQGTVFIPQKSRRQVEGSFGQVGGVLSGLSGTRFVGYEIHMGITETGSADPLTLIDPETRPDGMAAGNVYGCYIHGVLDSEETLNGLLRSLLAHKGLDMDALHAENPDVYRERQFDILEKGLRDSLDMDYIYKLMEEGV